MERMFAIMLSNLGLNPEEIMKQIQNVSGGVTAMLETMQRIEAKQDAMQKDIDAIKRHVGVNIHPGLTIEGKNNG